MQKSALESIMHHYFGHCGSTFTSTLGLVIAAMLRGGTCNTAVIAQNMNHDTAQSFKANDVRLYRFLKDTDFQVDDRLFRCVHSLVFDALAERAIIKNGDRILIKVDFTTVEDHFLILSASVDFNGRSIPLYFSMRRYYKKADQMDQKKMELAFLKALRHILSKKYDYVIVADRGFGNQRFASVCKEVGFGYVLRMNTNLTIKMADKKCNLNNYAGSDFDITAEVKTWKETKRFIGCTKVCEDIDDEKRAPIGYWVLMTDLPDKSEEIVAIYEQRFGIEKCFQDAKSSGFDIEKSKIRKYDRFKRLFFCASIAQILMVILGEFIATTDHIIKKKFPLFAAVLLVFLSLGKGHAGLSSKSV